MAETPIHRPHDKLFKASFSYPVNAAALLREQLPPALAGHIAWELPRLEPGSFVDFHNRHTESDLLFTVPLAGPPARLYLPFEHQRQPEPDLALRLLRHSCPKSAVGNRRSQIYWHPCGHHDPAHPEGRAHGPVPG